MEIFESLFFFGRELLEGWGILLGFFRKNYVLEEESSAECDFPNEIVRIPQDGVKTALAVT